MITSRIILDTVWIHRALCACILVLHKPSSGI
nr:MAG TPA: hypothetical protein [Caudoviricetes sp.]